MPDAPPRPPSLTMACLFVAIASAMVLIELVAVLSSWTSLDVQDALREGLRDPMLQDLGISTDRMIEVLRVAAYAFVPVAAAGLVFSIYAMRGHRTSRVILTVLCGFGFFVFAATGIAGILPAALLLASGFMLWSRDARRWYALKNGSPLPAESAVAARPDPFATRPGTPPTTQQQLPAAVAPRPEFVHPAAAPVDPAAADRRPTGVLVAGIVTVIGSLSTLGFGLLMLAVSTVGETAFRQAVRDSEFMSDYLRSANISVDTMLQIYLVGGIVLVVLGVLGSVAGALLLARRRVGLHATRVMCVVTLLASVPTVPLGLVTGGAAVYVLVLLLKPVNVAWFTRSGSRPPTRG